MCRLCFPTVKAILHGGCDWCDSTVHVCLVLGRLSGNRRSICVHARLILVFLLHPHTDRTSKHRKRREREQFEREKERGLNREGHLVCLNPVLFLPINSHPSVTLILIHISEQRWEDVSLNIGFLVLICESTQDSHRGSKQHQKKTTSRNLCRHQADSGMVTRTHRYTH